MNKRYAVRTITTPAGAIRYEVSGYDAKGKQHRKRFKSEAEAEGEKHRLEMADSRVENNSRVVQTRLTKEQVAEAEQCFDMLPAGITLLDAVKRLVGAWNEGERPQAMRDALVEHMDDMERRGCSQVTIRGTRSKIKRFISENDFAEVPIDQINADDLKSWIGDLKSGSRKAYRLALSGLWTFAVSKKWCKVNLVSQVPAVKPKKTAKKSKVSVLSVDQSKAMLKAAVADEKSLAWTAVAIFAGLRPEAELQHLGWDAVDFRAGNIYVERSKTDTAERHIKMHPTLKAWLQLATGQPFNLTRADLKNVKRAAGYRSGLTRKEGGEDHKADEGLAAYPADVTRHTFGSFLYGRELNYNEVADQMGNSAAIVKRHYKRALPQEQVEAFWNLTPENVLADTKLKAVG